MSWKVADLSKYNTISNYDTFANNIDGALLRVGYRSYSVSGTLTKDTKFETHYNGLVGKCKLGFYWFSTAISKNEAIEEANYVYNIIKNKHCDFPIYLDSEYSNNYHTGRSDNLSKEARTNYVVAFCNRIIELGYRAGVYASDSWYATELDLNKLYGKYSLWVARYSSNPPQYVDHYDAWQYTSEGSIVGASGNIDLSNFYTDVANWEENSITTQIDINNFAISIDKEEYTYTGSQIQPQVEVENLKLGTDYILDFKNNINVGIGTIAINGINNYTGSVTKSFNIVPKSLTGNYEIHLDPIRYTYTSESIIPTLYIPGLVENRDYIVSCEDNVNVGTARVACKGINNYQYYIRSNFYIDPKDINDIYIDYQNEYTYIGLEIKPEVSIGNFEEGKDYTVEYFDNINVGIGTIFIKGIGNFTGHTEKTFNIVEEAIADEEREVTFIPARFTYTGEYCIPEVHIQGINDEDFEVELYNNLNAGTAYAKITGINNFRGEITREFTIMPKSISSYESNDIEDQYYTGTYIEPEVIIDGLTYKTDYLVQFRNNKVSGTATVIVSGIGNYSGSITTEFNIISRSITMCDVKVGTSSIYTPYRIDGPLVVKSVENGYIMQENIDYIVRDYKKETINKEFNLVSYTLEGIGQFYGEETFRFRVVDIDPVPEPGDDNYQTYNENNDSGLNIDKDGTDKELEIEPEPFIDDMVYNFGDIDEDDESAIGDYDFGDEDEGVEEDTVAKGNYDFNIINDEEYVYDLGTEFDLDNTPIYANYCSTVSSGTRSGVYFVYKTQIVNGRIRLTKLESALDSPVRTTGWFNISDLELLGKFKVGEPALVTGRVMKYTNGSGEYFEVENQLMYVVEISDDEQYDYPYGVAYSNKSKRVGFASFDMMSKVKNIEDYL